VGVADGLVGVLDVELVGGLGEFEAVCDVPAVLRDRWWRADEDERWVGDGELLWLVGGGVVVVGVGGGEV
jgi:hypothetical protein